MNIPLLKLHNNVELPAFGLGVYCSSVEDTAFAVRTALETGYPLIDTAAVYMNEKEVGQGILDSGVPRADIFIQTKLWTDDYGYDQALKGFDVSMAKLKLKYLDLYLLHWPKLQQFEQTIESWKALNYLYKEGRVRAIGVCNFNPEYLTHLVDETGVVPMVNQIELHPFFNQQPLREANKKLNIITQAWSPIGGVARYKGEYIASRDPLQNEQINLIAKKYHKSAAQIILRWHIELGNAVIPKSVNATRIDENIDIFDFELTNDEIAIINALNTDCRSGSDPKDK